MTDKANLNRPSIRKDPTAYANSLAAIQGILDTTYFADPFKEGFKAAMSNFKDNGGTDWWDTLDDFVRENYLDGLLLMRENYQKMAKKALSEVQRRQFRAAEDGFQWGRVAIAHLHRDRSVSVQLAAMMEVSIP